MAELSQPPSQHDMFPLGEDATPYRKLTADHVATARFNGDTVLTVGAPALTLLTQQAFHDIGLKLSKLYLSK